MGHLPAIVATASLELGITWEPLSSSFKSALFPSVSSGLQTPSLAASCRGNPEGVSFPKHDLDLLASAVVQKAMLTGQIEASSYPRNPLDVLAQQIAAMIAMNDRHYKTSILWFGDVQLTEICLKMPLKVCLI